MNPLDLLTDFTLRNVMLGAALLGVASGVLGTFAVLRRESLLGDLLSHAALPGVCLGFLLTGTRQLLPIMGGALLTGVASALLMLLLTRQSRLKSDAATGIALGFSFAVGTVLLTYIGNRSDAGQAGLDSFLFGQAAALLPSDVVVMAAVTLGALLLVTLLWKELALTTFDREFAASVGLDVRLLDLVTVLAIALAVVIGLQLVGVVLMTAMVVAPAAAARQWSRNLTQMVVIAALFGAVSGVAGALVSATRPGLSTGPLIVVSASALVLASLLFAPQRGLVRGALDTYRNRARLRGRRILVDLLRIAEEHGDPGYAAETGMIRSFYGVNPERELRRLAAAGLVTRERHMPEEGTHWALTERGLGAAREVLGPAQHAGQGGPDGVQRDAAQERPGSAERGPSGPAGRRGGGGR